MEKSFFKSLLLSLIAAMLPQLASAYDFMVDDIAYNINSDGTSVTVTYKEYWSSNNYSGLTTANIPSTVTYNGTTYSVTSIGDEAFLLCNSLSSVSIPNSVTEIDFNPFCGCKGLTSIVVESGNTKYDSRNNCNAIIETASNTLISGCKNTVISNSVTSIGEEAFYECTGLTSIDIPNSVTTIGRSAFEGCTGLTSVTIPNSVTEIGNEAFESCSGLTTLTLTGQGAWNSLGGSIPIYLLKTVNIGSGITSLGYLRFTPDVVNCYAETPPVCSSGTFSNYDGVLHVPVTSIADYFMAYYWQNFNNIVNDLTEKVTLDKTSANLVQWETLELTATVAPEESDLLWSSTNPSVATVDENGIVTATGEGECDIYATFASNPAVYAWCHITSSYPEISLSLSEESLDMNVGDEQTLNCTVTPDNTGLTPTWSSSNTSVATVDENGKVTAIGEGECDINATVLDKTATCHVTVSGDVTITLNIDKAIMGASQMLTVYPACTPDVPVELVVTSSDPSVAVARVVNRTNAPAQGLQSFPEKDMAMAYLNEVANIPAEIKVPAYASEKAIMIVGVQNGTATITVTTSDGMAVPAVLELRVADVDGDRTITSTDITCLYNYLLNGDYTFIATSDVDGDGYVTSGDITVLYNLLLGN